MYQIEFTTEAFEDLKTFRKFDRKKIVADIESQLAYEPMVETRNRKRLRPNKVAEWEIRLGRFRVFYDVDDEVEMVKIEAIGYKEGERLFIRRAEYKL